jgi:NAD+ synthase
MKPAFVTATPWRRLEGLAKSLCRWAGAGRGRPVVGRSAALQCLLGDGGGKIAARVLKHHLPNDTVFDEVRQFSTRAMSPAPTGSARCASARRFAKMPGTRM